LRYYSGRPNLWAMYVCLCRGVSDRKVRKAIARGAATVEDLARTCGAGSGCGGCRPELQAMLRDARGGCEDPVSVATPGLGRRPVLGDGLSPALSRR
jgi:bacterioferritin-associated ferredoxin